MRRDKNCKKEGSIEGEIREERRRYKGRKEGTNEKEARKGKIERWGIGGALQGGK